MKTKIILPFFVIAATFVLNGNLNAQRYTRITDATNDMVSINNMSVSISNLFMLDSITQQEVGQVREFKPPIIHQASFEMTLTSGDAINVLKALYAGINGQPLPSLVISRLNVQGQAVDEREFTMVTVKEIGFHDLNADAKAAAKVKVVLQAEEVMYNNNPGYKGVSDSGRLSKISTGNKFRIVVGELPADDVLQISNLTIVSSTTQSNLQFTLDIPMASAKGWSDWFNTTRDRQTKDATISLVDAAGSQPFVSIEIPQVEIVSMSVRSTPGSIARTTIGLRTNQLPTIN